MSLSGEIRSDAADLTLAEAAAAIAARRLSSREATEACLARISIWQPRLNAYLALDADAALAAADAADAAIARGGARGALHGVPMAHKDMFYRAGHVVTCGSAIRRDWTAPATATVLSRLNEAGAVYLGALNMAEFAFGPTGHNEHFGHARNPWNPLHATGGSSSGSGAAVAARTTFAALGSDTGGSVRMPAHFCGVTGLKTTTGRVSRAHAMPLSQSLDTIGPLARTAEDCALVLQAIAGADREDPTARDLPAEDFAAACRQSARGLRVGLPNAFYTEGLDGDTGRVLDETLASLRGEGVEIVAVDLPDQDALSAAAQIVLAAEAATFHARWLRERPRDYGAQVRARLENGLAVTAVQYLEALRRRGPALAAHLEAVSGLDAVLAPVARFPAPTLAESDVGGGVGAEGIIQAITRFVRPVNYLGLPSLVVPAGRSAAGLPIGMQLVGAPFAEAVLLRLGAAFQRASDHHQAAPEPAP